MLAIAAVVFLALWVINAAIVHLPAPVSTILAALALACAVGFAVQQARHRRTPPPDR